MDSDSGVFIITRWIDDLFLCETVVVVAAVLE
jgi:hypothetical protein